MIGVALVGVAGAYSASAAPFTYNLAATKACLSKKGAQFQSASTGAQAKLRPAQRSESAVGTLPAGNEPLFLYLAIARKPADAVAIRNALKKSIVPNPTAANSWSGEKANAAWTVVSLGGAPPPAAAHKLLLSCLTKGRPSGTPATYDKDEVALCMQAEGRAAILSAKDVASTSNLLLGRTIPSRFVPHLLFGFTSTSASAKDGLRLFALFGKTHADALSLRTRLDRALGGLVLGPRTIWAGSKKNVAWAAQRINGTTRAGIASGKQTLLSCLL